MRILLIMIMQVAACSIVFNSCVNTTSENEQAQNISRDLVLENRVDSVLALMTLDEKVGQMVLYSARENKTGPLSNNSDGEWIQKLKEGKIGSLLNVVTADAAFDAQKLVMENSRLKIPLLFGFDVIHGFKTIFPIPLGESASWDLDLIELAASVAALEAAASGINWTFAPMLDVSRDARWGRIMEGAGEDPYLVSQVGLAKIRGFQGDDLSKPNTIAACAKHFAAYGFAEAGKDYNTANIGVYELHNQVLPPFKAAAEAGVATFMNAFNDIDGIPATGHKALQRELLKSNWGWEGFVVSDWGSIGELIAHGYAINKKHAAELAVTAGSDMDMESYAYEEYLPDLVEEGRVPVEYLDDAVRRILRVKFQLGLFDDPYKYCNSHKEINEVNSLENLNLAREIARKSIVLLKNENKLLPIDKNIKSIAVIGPLANDKDTPLGNWRGQGKYNSAVSLLEGIKSAVGSKTSVYYEKGVDLHIPNLEEGENQFLHPLVFNENNKTGIPAAVEIARNADVVILALGENAYQTGEGRSQSDIGFAGLQNELLDAVKEVNSNIILVVMNGRPMTISRATDCVPSILNCWHLGSEAGNAIADIIFGKENPSGKLPVSFPRNVGQEPLYYNHKITGRPYSEDHVTYSAYRDVSNSPLYPFGFGLSYTNFQYDSLTLDKKLIYTDEEIIVSVSVSNIGKVDGEEVVQLYIQDMVGSLVRPVRELKGFKKILIRSGMTEKVTFTLKPELLQFFTVNMKWEVEPGEFKVFIGGDSQASLTESFTVVE